ncbi:MAG: metallophosphoesterase, partial [Oscillospiraceae bacterium]
MKNTKRIVSALLAGAVTVGVVSSFALTSADVTSTAKFDENNIVLSFGSMSDLHFASSDSHGHDKMLNKAVATFQDLAGGKDKLDAVLLAGDLTDYGTKDEFAKPAQRFKDALAGTDTEVV